MIQAVLDTETGMGAERQASSGFQVAGDLVCS